MAQSPGTRLIYSGLQQNLNTISKYIENLLNRDINDGVHRWVCSTNTTISPDGFPNFFINITNNYDSEAHLSFHFGRSQNWSGATHLKYGQAGPINRLELNRDAYNNYKFRFMSSFYPNFEHVVLQGLNVFTPTIIVNTKYLKYQEKYLKYKTKYLELKKLLAKKL